MSTSSRVELRPIPRIPASLHIRARTLGLVVEVYHQTIAGHGHTGRICYAISRPAPEWDDMSRVVFGLVATSDERALITALTEDLEAIEARQEPDTSKLFAHLDDERPDLGL